jgi:diguanylate cyclase (GGDEF)-like protein
MVRGTQAFPVKGDCGVMELRRSNPYLGADLPRAQRFTRALWTGGVAVVLALLPFYPPTVSFGARGWLIMAPVVVAILAACWFAWRPSIGFRGLLYVAYCGFFGIAVVSLLAEANAPYDEIFLMLICAVSLMHPLQIALPFGVVVTVSHVGLTFVQAGEVGEAVMQAGVWLTLSVVLSAVMTQTRDQRWQLHVERSVDSLTGLLNRRQFDEHLAAAVEEHSASGVPLSLIVADVNGFKALNDEHGHTTGDEQLILVATALTDGVRAEDTCFRWGGDEFAVLLPGADRTTAGLVASRAREAVAEACLAPGRLTIGVGHADLREGETADELLRRADTMLLAVKAARRSPVSDRLPTARLSAAGV